MAGVCRLRSVKYQCASDGAGLAVYFASAVTERSYIDSLKPVHVINPRISGDIFGDQGFSGVPIGVPIRRKNKNGLQPLSCKPLIYWRARSDSNARPLGS